MCGIAGIILPKPGDIGKYLVDMLDGCQHRGPDSTGYALYHEKKDDTLILRIYLSCSSDSPQALVYE
ncbi:MAG: amidophosphoribosyltransferase, partial [Armatimonadota bacterium]